MAPVSTGSGPVDVVGQSLGSVPMTPSASGTTAASGSSGTGGQVTPQSSTSHSESGDSEAERKVHLHKVQPFQSPPAGETALKSEIKEKDPRTLIDLPVDVLKEIVKEVQNTNDLVSLSLTCRCLHALAIPHIYSRFDIVWPESDALGDRPGVDALTYGLSTLTASGKRGNDYARWIRKFSLGNGPSDWVDEYNVSKESGKMLGTLINLALMRMENLETFNWDMPTGVLRDIFMTLHDLCPHSLRNVHVRFHDNRDTSIPVSQDPSRRVESPTFKGFKALRQLSVLDIDERKYIEEMAFAIEHSVDTLKELRVGLAEHVAKTGQWIWDLDEVDNTESPLAAVGGSAVGGVLGILVNRVCDLPERKKKLRVDAITVAATATPQDAAPIVPQTGTTLAAPLAPVATQPPTEVTTGMGTAMIVDEAAEVQVLAADLLTASAQPIGEDQAFDVSALVNALPAAGTASLPQSSATIFQNNPVSISSTASPTIVAPATPPAVADPPKQRPIDEEEKPVKQLKLETLDLERVPLSVRVLQKAIDWSCLSNLTILNCPNHERLWKALRRKGSPNAPSSSNQAYMKTGYVPYGGTQPHRSSRRGAATSVAPVEYKIRLKKLHTDLVSPSLILFIKEALAPNSLEVLFLQENTVNNNSPMGYLSPVTIENIFKYCIKRHRLSLRKLLVDSGVGSVDRHTYESDKWRFNRDVLGFITTYGNMPNLRELGCAVDYQDWHYFLTRLPGLCGLRSLYIPHVKGAVQVQQAVSKEMALQVLDVVSLRNEVEMCYVGVISKCFELLEGKDDDGLGDMGDGINLDEEGDEADDGQDEDDTSEDDAADVFDAVEEEEGNGEGTDDDDELLAILVTSANAGDNQLGASGTGKEDDSDNEDGLGGGKGDYGKEAEKVKVRLREILFYDDKVAIFKARNGKL